jgi:AcrR family transcriptional regulator
VPSPPDDQQPRLRSARAPQRRNEQARIAVLHAADDLLAERGFAGVTVEGIAARAGVAKQTIYRWWPSKVEILLETLREDAEADLAVPARESAREEIRLRLGRLSRFLLSEPAGQVLLALIGQAQHDAATARSLQASFFDSQRKHDRERLARGVTGGELAADLRIDDALDALYGPLYYRALVTRKRIPRAFIDGLVASVLGPGPAGPHASGPAG